MLVCCWSVKGGVGTTVVAAALAIVAARRGDETLLVDVAGDQAPLLGVDASGPGLRDWLAAGEDVAVDALRRLEIPVCASLRLLAAGDVEPAVVDPERLSVALAMTERPGRTTVVDLGVVGPGDRRAAVLAGADRSILIVRGCYLTLRRARDRPSEPEHRVVLIDEPGRALGRSDVAHALGVDTVHRLAWEPAVARAVDAGTLASRLPGPLRRLERLL